MKVVGYLLLLLMHTLQRSLCYDYFQVDKNSFDDEAVDPSQYDCKPGMSVFNPPPCFAGDARLNVVVNEGETAQLRCYIYNVDFNKTYVSLIIQIQIIVSKFNTIIIGLLFALLPKKLLN